LPPLKHHLQFVEVNRQQISPARSEPYTVMYEGLRLDDLVDLRQALLNALHLGSSGAFPPSRLLSGGGAYPVTKFGAAFQGERAGMEQR
jgi:hypothetical protein